MKGSEGLKEAMPLKVSPCAILSEDYTQNNSQYYIYIYIYIYICNGVEC